jgi:D-alanyl-D-alanine carboxypeptidase/D-alanyl-D-alanine-endopeptidase (penicillin-binding protein 4)
MAIVLVYLDTSVAWSQGSAGTGTGTGSGSGAGSGSGSGEEEDDTSGSNAGLVAPKDPAARAKWLTEHLEAALVAHPTLAKAKLGIAIVDLATGVELFARDPDRGMNLASNTKLLTTFAALSTLGAGFRWRTAIYADKLDDVTGIVDGDLYVRGRGDPSLTDADLRALADDVAARGVREVKGHLAIDATYFDNNTEPPHFAEQPKERAAFRAPVAAFGVDASAVTIHVAAEPDGKARVWLEPEAKGYLELGKLDVKSSVDGKTKLKLEVKPTGDRLAFDLSGTLRVADGGWDRRVRIDDPTRFAGEVLRAALAARGVKLAEHAIALSPTPPTAKLLAAHDSATLATIVREMNKHSDNHAAETVLKTLGAETRVQPGAATWADGVIAVQTTLTKLGLPPTAYRADNGSGLYDASSVPAHQLVTILRAAHDDYRVGPDLVASLPVGGEDGTLAKRWHTRAARGHVRAKTGTLDKVVTLAGFVGVHGDHLLGFAILANDLPAGQRTAARALADDMLDALVAYLDPAR